MLGILRNQRDKRFDGKEKLDEDMGAFIIYRGY